MYKVLGHSAASQWFLPMWNEQKAPQSEHKAFFKNLTIQMVFLRSKEGFQNVPCYYLSFPLPIISTYYHDSTEKFAVIVTIEKTAEVEQEEV